MCDPTPFYPQLIQTLQHLLSPLDPPVTTLSNASALLYQSLPQLNWAGFYLLRQGVLVLGPFQGKPACTRIPLGKGVCGQAAREGRTLRVPDVHQFPGHIACDSASASELVVPLFLDGALIGVLDLDSPVVNRFTAQDQDGLETAALAVTQALAPYSPRELERGV